MRVLTSGVKKLSADPLEARVAKSQILKHFQFVLYSIRVISRPSTALDYSCDHQGSHTVVTSVVVSRLNGRLKIVVRKVLIYLENSRL